MESSYSPNLPQMENFVQPYYQRRQKIHDYQNDRNDFQHQEPQGYSFVAIK